MNDTQNEIEPRAIEHLEAFKPRLTEYREDIREMGSTFRCCYCGGEITKEHEKLNPRGKARLRITYGCDRCGCTGNRHIDTNDRDRVTGERLNGILGGYSR